MTKSNGQGQYRSTLRVLGHWLDTRDVHRFTLLELPDAYTLMVEVGVANPEVVEVQFARDELLKDDAVRAIEKKPPEGERLHSGEPRSITSGRLLPQGANHETFLAGVGYELDTVGGHEFLLTTVGRDYLMTYSYSDSTKGFSWFKRRVTVDGAAMERLIQKESVRDDSVKRRGLFRRR